MLLRSVPTAAMAARKPPKSTGRGPRRRPSPRRLLKVTPTESRVVGDGKIRLNRFLSQAGICSRRAADELIAQGRVTVNGGQIRELGARVDPLHDQVCFDGERIAAEKPVYVLFNKPKDVVCTNARHEVRRRVIDFLPDVRGRIYTVGRLDADSQGLILLTNDGEFAQAVAHPRHGVPKTYAVLVRGRVERGALDKARGGVWLSEGRTAGAGVRIERVTRERTYLRVVLREGKNREIRRVFARLGHPVVSLKRIRIGDLNLHGMRPGGYRFLTAAEVQGLLALARGAS